MGAETDQDGAKEATVESDAPKKNKKLVLIAAPMVVLLTTIGGLGAAGMLPFLHHASASKKTLGIAAVSDLPVFVDLPEMVVNLDAGARHETFAKVQCRVEVKTAADGAKVTAVVPRIVDMLQTYLRAMRPDELQSGPGLYRLKEAFLARATIVVPEARVDDILFQELIVQ